MDALPTARSWADQPPNHSPLTATSAILWTSGTMASKNVHGAAVQLAVVPDRLLRWPVGALAAITSGKCLCHPA